MTSRSWSITPATTCGRPPPPTRRGSRSSTTSPRKCGRGAEARGDPPVRSGVLRRARRSGHLRRTPVARSATAPLPSCGAAGARARSRPPRAGPVPREPRAGGEAAVAAFPRRGAGRPGGAAEHAGGRGGNPPCSIPRPRELSDLPGGSVAGVRGRRRWAVQVGHDHARGGARRSPHGDRVPVEPRFLCPGDPAAPRPVRGTREPDRGTRSVPRVSAGRGDSTRARRRGAAVARFRKRGCAPAARGSGAGARAAGSPRRGRAGRGARGGAGGVKLPPPPRWGGPWLPPVGAALVRLLAATWRYRVRGWEHVEAARERRRPIVYVLWHSRILPLLYHRRGEGVALLVSRHRDGGYLAELSERWGYRVVRGSSRRGRGVGGRGGG